MKSNKLSLVIAAGALLVGITSGANADDQWSNSGSNWQEHIKSTKTRAEVIAELEQARAQGLLSVGEDPYYPSQPKATTSRSRAEVRAEAAQNPMFSGRSQDNLYFGG